MALPRDDAFSIDDREELNEGGTDARPSLLDLFRRLAKAI